MTPQNRWRLYFHIPYCHQICHYCDFAKTALFDKKEVALFFKRIRQQFLALFSYMRSLHGEIYFDSLYFGGGTPSLYSTEYSALFQVIERYLNPNVEVTLEANPNDICLENLKVWRDLGINRLSIGAQSLDHEGLKFLTRNHSVSDIYRSINLAAKFFDNLSLDLIYGWQNHTPGIWQRELKESAQLPLQHLSLYNLTYEVQTPIGRRAHRGLIKPIDDDVLFDFYQIAMECLADQGFCQEEVSNWFLPSFAAQHNRGYWNMDYTLAIGPGAHGFLPSHSDSQLPDIGLRYFYPRSEKSFLKTKEFVFQTKNHQQGLQEVGLNIDERSTDSWLLEAISLGCRSEIGIDLAKAEYVSGKKFQPTPLIHEATNKNILHICSKRILTLDPKEWFREQAWALKILDCFQT